MTKNTGDNIQDSHSTKFLCSLPNVEKTKLARANRDMISDYISKDCLLLAWILSGQPLPPVDTNISNVNFEEIENGNSLNDYGRLNSHIVSPTDNNLSLLSCKTYKEQQCIGSKSEYEDSLSSKTLAESDIYEYFQKQSRYNILNSNCPMDSIGKFQEFNELALTGRYSQ